MNMKFKKIGFLLLTSLSLCGACNQMEPVPETSSGVKRTHLTTPIDGLLIYDEVEEVVFYVDGAYISATDDQAERLEIAKERGVMMADLHFVVTSLEFEADHGKVTGDMAEFYYLTHNVVVEGETVEMQSLTYRYLNPNHNFGDEETSDLRPAYEYYVVRLSAEGERVDIIYYDEVEISSGTSDYFDDYYSIYIHEGMYINVNVTTNPNIPDPIKVEAI
ncbi:MAG: hypothetical protein ACOX3K_00305 [Bacilli bacterium]